jgi:hypothetical protein
MLFGTRQKLEARFYALVGGVQRGKAALSALEAKLGHNVTNRNLWTVVQALVGHEDPKKQPEGIAIAEILKVMAKPAAQDGAARPKPQSTATGKTLTPAEFRALSPYKRGVFFAGGGQIVAPTMNLDAFKKLSPRDRADFCRNGGQVTDD